MSVQSGSRQLLIHGMLFVVLGTALLALPHGVGLRSVRVMVVAAWLTWVMAMSEVANSWWGTTKMLPITASQAGAGLIVAWALLIVGFLKRPAAPGPGG